MVSPFQESRVHGFQSVLDWPTSIYDISQCADAVFALRLELVLCFSPDLGLRLSVSHCQAHGLNTTWWCIMYATVCWIHLRMCPTVPQWQWQCNLREDQKRQKPSPRDSRFANRLFITSSSMDACKLLQESDTRICCCGMPTMCQYSSARMLMAQLLCFASFT